METAPPSPPAFAFRCDACGAASDREDAYQRDDGRRRRTRYCLPCDALRTERASVRAGRFALALGGVALAVVGLAEDGLLTRLAWGYVNLGLLPLLLLVPTLVVHELGHWGTARLLGLPVHEVQIGSGPVLWRGRREEVRLRWHRYPILGHVLVSLPSRRWGRLRLAAVIAAGPATHAVWIAAAFWGAHAFGQLGEGSLGLGPLSTGPNLVVAVVFLNFFDLLLNLLPARYGSTTTDGAVLLALPFLGREQVDALVESRFATPAELAMADADWEEAERWILDGLRHAPDSLILKVLAACLQAEAGHCDRAVSMLRPLYARDGLDAPARAAVANALAWCLCQLDDPADLEERDARLLEARRQLGEQPSVLSTWGACLLADGRPGEAWPLLANSLSKLHAPDHRASVLCNLARAEHRLGLTAQARRRLAEARAASPRNALLERTNRELSRPAPPADAPRRMGGAAAAPALPVPEPATPERRRRIPGWVWVATAPVCVLAWSCGPPFLQGVITMNVPHPDVAQEPPSEEQQAACSAGLATLERWGWLLARLPDPAAGWSRWREAQRAQLEACAGNLERAHQLFSDLVARETAKLDSEDPSAPLGGVDGEDWDRYGLALAAFEHRLALYHLELRMERPAAAATLARAGDLARRLDLAWPANPEITHRARLAHLEAAAVERRDGPAAALAHVEGVVAAIGTGRSDAQLAPLLTLEAELLERLGRETEADATWARIGRAGRDAYASGPIPPGFD